MRNKKGARAVKQAFSREDLALVCTMHEQEFPDVYGLEKFEEGDQPDDFFAFRDNGADVLAVAHLDTVVRPDERTARFIDTRNGTLVNSGALDDRLGAYTVLELLPKLGIIFDTLLTTGEEYGCSTAAYFEARKEYRYMIEFDRGGTDVVMYQYEDYALRQRVKAAGAVVGPGIFSDISYMEHLGIKGLNWGVGYRDYHSTRGHAYLRDYWAMIGRYRRFHELNAGVVMPHAPQDDSDDLWYRSYRRGAAGFSGSRYVSGPYSAAGPDGKRCWYCGAEAVDATTGYCGECTACDDCGEFEADCSCWVPPRNRGNSSDGDASDAVPRTYQEWLDANGLDASVDSYLAWQDSHRKDTGALTYSEWLDRSKTAKAS